MRIASGRISGMRIGYDAAPLLNPLTGVGHYALTLLERMLAIDPEVEFELLALTIRADTSRVPVGDRVRLKHLRIPARWAVTGWERLRRPSSDVLLGSVDVVHGTNFWVPPLSKRNGVVTIHDLTFWLYPELCTPQVQRYRWIVPKVLDRCAAVITPSKTIKEQVTAELGFDADRTFVTAEGIRGSFLDAKPDPTVAQRLGVHGDYVLFTGTQEPRKNLDRLIRAFAALDLELTLVIAGPPGWGSIDLPAVAHKAKVEHRVVFSGYLTDPELGSLMLGAKAFVFPTLYEGFGLPPLEAMAAGIPVVAARAGSLPEVLGDAPFYCDPLDVASIAQAIERAVIDDEARDLAVAEGKAVIAGYDWDETARQTLDVYRFAGGL